MRQTTLRVYRLRKQLRAARITFALYSESTTVPPLGPCSTSTRRVFVEWLIHRGLPNLDLLLARVVDLPAIHLCSYFLQLFLPIIFDTLDSPFFFLFLFFFIFDMRRYSFRRMDLKLVRNKNLQVYNIGLF